MRLPALFARDHRGVAAVELALIAPVLAGVTLVSFEAWRYASRAQEMRDAVKAGVNYYMNGGTADAAAESIAESAWSHAPADASVAVSRACFCGTTVQVCTSLCADSTVPQVQISLRATGTYPDSYFAKTLATEQVLRVR
jgi:Flp pilus assembly protein TadG